MPRFILFLSSLETTRAAHLAFCSRQLTSTAATPLKQKTPTSPALVPAGVSLTSAACLVIVRSSPPRAPPRPQTGLETTTSLKTVAATGSTVTCASRAKMGRRKIEIKAIKDDRNRSVYV